MNSGCVQRKRNGLCIYIQVSLMAGDLGNAVRNGGNFDFTSRALIVPAGCF